MTEVRRTYTHREKRHWKSRRMKEKDRKRELAKQRERGRERQRTDEQVCENAGEVKGRPVN